MKKDDTLGEAIPIRLWKVDQEEINRIAAALGLPVQDLIRRIIKAGAAAIKANGYQMPLPLHFQTKTAPIPAPFPAATGPPDTPYPSKAEERMIIEEKPSTSHSLKPRSRHRRKPGPP